MAWTESDLAKLEAAIATGVLRVRYADHDVTYQSTADMLKARAAMQREINAAASRSSVVRVATNKGLG